MVENKKWKIVLAEDHALFRAALRSLLEKEPDLGVIGEAGDGRDAVRLVAKNPPDILVTDLHMPGSNGFEAISAVRRRHPRTRILVVTMYRDCEYVEASLRAGADGYLLKTAAAQELVFAVRRVLAGEGYLTPEISNDVLIGAGANGDRDERLPSALLERLTSRERQVLQLVAEGRSNKYIANYLFVSAKTVDKHRTNLMNKLKVHNVTALTSFAIAAGVVLAYGDPELKLRPS